MKHLVLLLILVVLLVLGLFVPSEQFAAELSRGPEDLLRLLTLVGILAVTHGWTNMLLLAVITAHLGSVIRTPSVAKDTRLRFATIRGFFIWILLVGGQAYFEADAPPVTLTQPEYTKMTLTALVLAFLVGYNPNLLSTLIRRAETFAGAQAQPPK